MNDAMKKGAAALGLALVALIAVLVWLALRDTPDARAPATPSANSPADEAPSSELAPPADIVVERDAPAVVPVEEPEATVASGETPTLCPSDTRLITLHVFVRHADGRTAFGSEVEVDVTNRLGWHRRAEESSGGGYSVSGLEQGPCWISVDSKNDGSAFARIELVWSEPERQLELQLTLPLQVLVKVVDRTGEPLKGLTALATLTPPGEWIDEVTLQPNVPLGVGRFSRNGDGPERLPEAYLGRLLFDVPPPLHVSVLNHQRVLATQRVEQDQSEIEFVVDRDSHLLEPAWLRIRFVDAVTGARLEKGSVRLGMNAGPWMAKNAGEYRSRVSPGAYDLVAAFEGYERVHKRVFVQPGIENDFGDVPLQREMSITGVVTDELGAGVSIGLNVFLLDEVTGQLGPNLFGNVGNDMRSREDGSFEILQLSRARYVLRNDGYHREESRWGLASQLADLRNGPVADVRFQLTQGVPLVLRPSSETWRDVRYDIRNANKLLVTSSHFWSVAPYRLLLAPGRYEVEVRVGESGEPKLIPVTLRSGPVELALP